MGSMNGCRMPNESESESNAAACLYGLSVASKARNRLL